MKPGPVKVQLSGSEKDRRRNQNKQRQAVSLWLNSPSFRFALIVLFHGNRVRDPERKQKQLDKHSKNPLATFLSPYLNLERQHLKKKNLFAWVENQFKAQKYTVSIPTDLIKLRCTPRDLCVPEQSIHRNTP